MLNGITPRAVKSFSDVGIMHQQAVKLGFLVDVQMGTHLMGLYSKSGCLESACKMFDEMPHRNTVTWTVLITSFSTIGRYSRALEIFSTMVKEGNSPNCITLAGIFKCYARIRVLKQGKSLHGWIIRKAMESDTVLVNSMVDFYGKCGALSYASTLFDSMPERDHTSWNIMIEACLKTGDVQGSVDLFTRLPYRDVVSWNTVINGLIKNDYCTVAMKFLYQMAQEGPSFSHFTFSMALSLVGTVSLLDLGREIHGRLLRSDANLDGFVRCSLIDMYGKCGSMEYASNVFRMIRDPSDTISCSSMVAGYVHNQMHEEALNFFQNMLDEHVMINFYTLTTVTAICSLLGILAVGRQIHGFAVKSGYASDIYLSSAIIDMYGKCGSLDDARSIFKIDKKDNLVLWTSLIASYASHGRGREAVETFEMMLYSKIIPNEVTFLNVLCACSHAGLVKEGYKYLRMMREEFGLVPSVEHLTCVVDLLGKAGLIKEAINFIYENNISKVSASWMSLLSACRLHRNVDVASMASDKLLEIDGFDASHLLLLSNTYLASGDQEHASRISMMMEKNGVHSRAGLSWIQLENRMHIFIAGDQSHPQIDEINYCLSKLILRLKGMNV